MTSKVNGQSKAAENEELDMLVLREIEALEKLSGRQERSSPLQMVKEETEHGVSLEEEPAREDGEEKAQEVSGVCEENICEVVEDNIGVEKFITDAVHWLQGRDDGKAILDRIQEALFSPSVEENNV